MSRAQHGAASPRSPSMSTPWRSAVGGCCAVCVCSTPRHSCGRWGVAAWVAGGGGPGRRRCPVLGPSRKSNQTPRPAARVPYDMVLYPKCDLTCRSGSIICFVVGRSALWTCQNQRQDRQAATIGTAWSQGSALRGSSDGKEPRGDCPSFEPLIAACVNTAIEKCPESLVVMRVLRLSA